MLLAMSRWIGVDVGGRRRGFDVAMIDEQRLLVLAGGLDREAVVELVAVEQPRVVAIDSPRCCAPTGRTARAGERLLVRTICGIRWTPDRATVEGNPYYAWIVEGLKLFEALADLDIETIEVFPTASWTRWFGPRDARTRATWTELGVARLGLDALPSCTNQDERDAIAAAMTARQYSECGTEAIGEIVVPTALTPGGEPLISVSVELAPQETVGWPERKQWWRNLKDGAQVEMRIRGQRRVGHAQARGDERTGVSVEVELNPDLGG